MPPNCRCAKLIRVRPSILWLMKRSRHPFWVPAVCTAVRVNTGCQTDRVPIFHIQPSFHNVGTGINQTSYYHIPLPYSSFQMAAGSVKAKASLQYSLFPSSKPSPPPPNPTLPLANTLCLVFFFFPVGPSPHVLHQSSCRGEKSTISSHSHCGFFWPAHQGPRLSNCWQSLSWTLLLVQVNTAYSSPMSCSSMTRHIKGLPRWWRLLSNHRSIRAISCPGRPMFRCATLRRVWVLPHTTTLMHARKFIAGVSGAGRLLHGALFQVCLLCCGPTSEYLPLVSV